MPLIILIIICIHPYMYIPQLYYGMISPSAGLDGQFVDVTVYPHICQARAWLLASGFSLAFGSMFSKIWRVHRLATKAKAESKVEVSFQPRHDPKIRRFPSLNRHHIGPFSRSRKSNPGSFTLSSGFCWRSTSSSSSPGQSSILCR